MFRLLFRLFAHSFLLVSVFGQTTTTFVNQDGSTVVGVVTTDANSGEPTTIILSTIITTTPATTTPPADPPGQQQGPVGAPPDTSTITGPPQIVYVYTTSDAAGVRQVITTTFTPTYQTPNPTTPLSSGSVWAFSDYTAHFGAASTTGAANSLVAARPGVWKWTVACGVIALGAGGMVLN